MTEPQLRTVRAGALTFGTLSWDPPAGVAGEGDARLALLLHGYPDTPWTWRHLGPHLAAAGWRVVAPFTRGYGPTGPAPDGRSFVTDLVDDVLALHEALGGDDRAALIGHDWGAVQTWGVAAREPGRFAHHVAMSIPPTPALLDPIVRRPRALRLAARQAMLSWYFVYNVLPGVQRTLPRTIPAHWRAWSPGYDATEDVAHVLDALDTPERRRAALGYYRDNLVRGIVETFSIRPRAAALYLHGAQDGCMQVQVGARAQHLLAAGSRFEAVADAGHWLHLERPAHVAQLITDWLGRSG